MNTSSEPPRRQRQTSPNLRPVADEPTIHVGSPEATQVVEEALLGSILNAAKEGDSSVLPAVRALVSRDDFAAVDSRTIYAAMLRVADAGEPVEFANLIHELDREPGRLERAGGSARIHELDDYEAGCGRALVHARHVRERALERRARVLHSRAREATGDDLAEIEGELAAVTEARDAIVSRQGDLGAVSFRGARLLELLERPAPEPVHAGVPVRGHLMMMVAAAFTGKTSWELCSAMARAGGVAAWTGAPLQPAGRVLILSPDEAAEQIARRMRGLSLLHPAGGLARYAHNLEVLAPDRGVDPAALDGLRFAAAGLEKLTRYIEAAAASGDPFTEVYIDAYADTIPAGESENSNELGTAIGGALERLAIRTGAAVVLLHHVGKPRADREEVDVQFLGRGATALAAKARVVASLEGVAGLPHLRRIRTRTNLGPAPREALFEVCAPQSAGEELIYFRPHDALAAHDPAKLIGSEAITTNGLAWRLSGKDPDDGGRPPGDCTKLAAKLRNEWERRGLVTVEAGPNRSKLIKYTGGAPGAP